MLVKQAVAVARQWVADVGRSTPGFAGAYMGGSASDLASDAPFPSTSDLDVYLVVEDAERVPKRGKFVYEGVLLEASLIARQALRSPEAVLGHYHLAGGLVQPGILADPTGMLTALHEAVARDFAKRCWVRQRCEHAMSTMRSYAQSLAAAAPIHDQVTTCVFAAGVMTHVLLVAGLRNPTIRKRYAAVRKLLESYGQMACYEPLLALLGCAAMGRQQVEQHLMATTQVFDAARLAIKTPYRFAADISDAGRPVAIDGSRELIERGLHREAVFWIAATYSRCRTILTADAPELLVQFDPGYQELLTDLGIATFLDRQARCRAIEAYLPQLWQVAEEIMASNREII
jgi:hypothetical protein